MKCPFCHNSENRVLESRLHRDGNLIRRRRECLKCKQRFTTQETLVPTLPMVIKKDGRREPFNQEKVFSGIKAACQKRPIALACLENLVEETTRWASTLSEKEVSARDIGFKVMSQLKQVDDVAYVRFASVYKTFRDVHEFVENLDLEDDNRAENTAGSEPSVEN